MANYFQTAALKSGKSVAWAAQ